MFPVGGVGVMLLGAVAAGALAALVRLVLRPWLGRRTATLVALLLWSLAGIALVTLIPAQGAPGIVPAEGRATSCSWDIGGPAPDGFWILPSGQRVLNALLFLPSGVLLVLVLTRWPRGWRLLPFGLLALVGYSVAIEATQLGLARIDRACDVTDVLDNTLGAVLGVLLGTVLALPGSLRRGRAASPRRT